MFQTRHARGSCRLFTEPLSSHSCLKHISSLVWCYCVVWTLHFLKCLIEIWLELQVESHGNQTYISLLIDKVDLKGHLESQTLSHKQIVWINTPWSGFRDIRFISYLFSSFIAFLNVYNVLLEDTILHCVSDTVNNIVKLTLWTENWRFTYCIQLAWKCIETETYDLFSDGHVPVVVASSPQCIIFS